MIKVKALGKNCSMDKKYRKHFLLHLSDTLYNIWSFTGTLQKLQCLNLSALISSSK